MSEMTRSSMDEDAVQNLPHQVSTNKLAPLPVITPTPAVYPADAELPIAKAAAPEQQDDYMPEGERKVAETRLSKITKYYADIRDRDASMIESQKVRKIGKWAGIGAVAASIVAYYKR